MKERYYIMEKVLNEINDLNFMCSKLSCIEEQVLQNLIKVKQEQKSGYNSQYDINGDGILDAYEEKHMLNGDIVGGPADYNNDGFVSKQELEQHLNETNSLHKRNNEYEDYSL